VLVGNANWNAEAARSDQAPVYFVEIDEVWSTIYSTSPVYNPVATEHVILGFPQLSPASIDMLEGTWTVGNMKLLFHDVAGEASALFGSGAPGAPVGTWKNRRVTLYGGYRALQKADFVKLFTGRVVGLKAMGATYELEVVDSSYLLDAEIMTGATEDKPTTITGNVVNVFVSILRGTFSVSDPDFPLESVSTDTGSSSAPTGLGLADTDLELVGMAAERDIWRPDDSVTVVLTEPESAREYLQREFFRVFQARLQVFGDGTLGFRFNVPALPATSAPVVDMTDIVGLRSWEQLIREHLNRFRIWGDYDAVAGEFVTELLGTDSAEDTADQAATDEVVEYLVESRWLTDAQNGVALAAELAGRLRQMWLLGPARVQLAVSFTNRRLEVGDVIAVTHADLPNLLTGALGVDSRLMSIVAINPDLEAGLVVLDCLDIGTRRYGVIAESGTALYPAATELERSTFGYATNSAGAQADGSAGHRMI